VSQLLALAEQIVVKAVSEKSANGGIIDFNQLIAEQSKAHRLNETERNTLIPLVNKGYINKTNMLDFDIATPSGVAAYLYNPKSATLNKSASVSETVDYTFPETSLDLASVATAELSTKQASTTEQNEDNRIFPKGCHGVNVTKLLKSATYNETREVLEPTIKAVLNSDYDPKKIILLLAYEERGGEAVDEQAKQLMAEYSETFLYAEAVKHPDGMPNEVRGKGGNITFTGRRLQEIVAKKGIDPKHVLVTTLDSDNRPHPQYLAGLTYVYGVCHDPSHLSFQPIPMFTNNIWDVPALMRVIATSNSFWMLVQGLRPHMLRNFSAHAQPLDALIRTDFWSTRTIVEDGHQFWRSYFAFDGRHEVVPIFLPIYQDAVLAKGYRRTRIRR
jgi:hypothetical protein